MNWITYGRILWGGKTVIDNAEHAAKESGVDTKTIFKSWTFWANIIAGAAEIAQQAGWVSLIPAPYDALAIAVVNIALRFKTNTAVTITGEAAPPPVPKGIG